MKVGLRAVACFWGTIFPRGTIFAWGGGVTMGFYGADLDSCPQIQGWRPKKRSSSRNLRLRHSDHPCFRRWTKVYFCLGGGGGTSRIFWRGGTGRKKHFSGTGPVTLVWVTIFTLRAQFSLRRHKQLLGGHSPEMPPQWRRAWVGPWQQKVGWLGLRSEGVPTISSRDLCWVSCLRGFLSSSLGSSSPQLSL